MQPDHDATDQTHHWAALVPELSVTDLDRSLAFYVDLCGFRIRYSRPENGFAYQILTIKPPEYPPPPHERTP